MNCEPVFDNPDIAQVWGRLIPVDDGIRLTWAALIDQSAVSDDGMPMLDVVDVDLSLGIDAVEELGFAGQVSLECGQAVERCALEVVASASVGAAGAAAAVSGFSSIGGSALALLFVHRRRQTRV